MKREHTLFRLNTTLQHTLSFHMFKIITEKRSSGPLLAIETARELHQLLLENKGMLGDERRGLARKISGHLFTAEADHILPDVCRAFFLRLRTDAFQRAASMDAKCLPHPDRIGAGYDQIEDGLRSQSDK